jgi:hypothetical protein
MDKNKHINILKLPFIVIMKEKILFCWVFTTLLGALFTAVSQFLIGEPIQDTFQHGNIYIFSITLIITVFSDAIIYLVSEDKKIEANKKLSEAKLENEKLIPIIGKTSINSYLLWIILFITFILITSLLLYAGIHRDNIWIQVGIFVFSVYIALFYYCLNRLIQYPNNYEDYLKTEKKEIENLGKKNEEINEYKDDITGKEVRL